MTEGPHSLLLNKGPSSQRLATPLDVHLGLCGSEIIVVVMINMTLCFSACAVVCNDDGIVQVH